MISKKSIVLNGVNENSQKALLSLECNGEITKGKIRLYNFCNEPKGIISLGIYHDGKVEKAGLTQISNMLFSFQSDIKVIPDTFSCAIVNFVGGEPKPLLYGSSDGYVNKDNVFDQVIEKLSNVKSMNNVEEALDEYQIEYDDELKEEINKALKDNITQEDLDNCNNVCSNCDNCKYRQYYFSHARSLESEKDIIEEKEIEEKKETQTFYLEMKEQIDRLFSNSQNEEYLEELIPNSKFARVVLEENNYYVLGLIYCDEEIKYICYGVPGIYQKNPPRELSGYPIWFPLEQDKPQGFGYWLTYQDANSGESVKAIIV